MKTQTAILGNNRINLAELAQAIWDGNRRGFASGETPAKLPNGRLAYYSTSQDGKFRYHDSWLGDEQFTGNVEVRLTDKNETPVWAMGYTGGFNLEEIKRLSEGKKKDIVNVLVEAMKRMPKEAPFRGPLTIVEKPLAVISPIYPGYENKGLKYFNKVGGDITRFSGREFINAFFGNPDRISFVEVFSTNYAGGLVIPKEGVVFG
jgi:hypothetical protein